MFQNLAEQFYHGQHESRKTVLDMLRISVDSIGQCPSKRIQSNFR